ncbi:MAG: hypothetical protein IPJ40_12250 [Saprospirales bacterium]|nr:hypothetical protein [Saprospirales bacterium]
MPLKISLFLCLLLASACHAQQKTPGQVLPEGKQVILLDSLEAAYRVSRDTKEGFFERIGVLDRSIQMKAENTPSEEDYREFLRRDVRSFKEKEKERLIREMQTIYALCARLSPHLLPDTLRLIKTHGQYYGPSVYYTREDFIVIPENELGPYPSQNLQDVLLHELFHVVSRYHPKFRKALYGLIGFNHLENPVIIPDLLQQRLLLNPDGSDFQWGITLEKEDGSQFLTTPLLFSRYDKFNARQPQFFSYLEFQLFTLEKDTITQQYVVQVSPEGRSTLGPDIFVQYLAQVRDNTDYLIHPDEVLADNFIYAVQGFEHPDRWDRFSEEGKALLQAISKFLNTWEGD